jgi:hypothetical protein
MKDFIPKVLCGSVDRPLVIGGKEIQCYVLQDERRVVVQSGMMQALDMKQGTAGKGSGDRLAKFISTNSIKPYVSDELYSVITNPIKFKTGKGVTAYGYEATILADLCDAVLEARKKGTLNYQQTHIADQCEILVRGFARVGIIALVDEATGYQEIRARRSLEEILDQFISKELRKWAKTFPDEFYKQMFKLRGWQYIPWSVKRPSVVGHYTNDLVYERLAPGVLEELKRQTPRDEKGRTKHRFFQRLTEDVGHPRLREHLTAVITLMKASTKWDQFYRLLQRSLPKYREQIPLDLEYPENVDREN